MRLLFSSVLFAVAGATSLAPFAHASMVYPEPNPIERTDALSLKFGAGSLGVIIFDGYRTLDGKNFYNDESSPRLTNNAASRLPNSAAFSGMFSAVTGSHGDAQPGSSQPSYSMTSFNLGNSGSGHGLGGGAENFSSGFGGGKGSSSSGGSSSKGMNPLVFAYTGLNADHGGFQGLGDGGGGVGKGDVSATPLPPAWTLMLIGLGCFGLFAHRRRKNERVFAVA